MDSKLLWLPLLLLVIAATAGTTNGEYTSTMIRDIVRERIMKNKCFACYPKMQASFSQYAVMMILPEPPLQTSSAIKLFPDPHKVSNVNNEYVVSPRSDIAVNYLVSRSFNFYDGMGQKQVRNAEPELMKRMGSLLFNWWKKFPKEKQYPTILLYTKQTPCSSCTRQIIQYRNNKNKYPFILAWTDEIGYSRKDYNRNNNNRQLMSKAGIYVVQVDEPANYGNIWAGCKNYWNTATYGTRIDV